MSFCSNCGSELLQNQKFCPTCGTTLTATATHAPQLHKGESKSLQDQVVKQLKSKANNYVEQQVKKIVQDTGKEIKNQFDTTRNNVETQTQSMTNEAQGGIDLWTWVYVAINAILLYLGYRNDEVIGVMLFSIVILLFVFLRISKPKPYNWLVKILLILQALLLLAFAMEKIEYPNSNVLLMLLMFVINLRLIFKGNKS